MSTQQREIPAPLSVFAFSVLVGRGDVYVTTSTDREKAERSHAFSSTDKVVYGVSPIVTLVREDAVKAERLRGDALRAAIGSLTDVLFAPSDEGAALTKALEMVTHALAQDDGALRRMKGIDP